VVWAALGRFRRSVVACLTALIASTVTLSAHDGPPFPIVSDRNVGPYVVSVWTDPDTTDDGSAGGQFWVRLRLAKKSEALPPETRATVSVTPIDRAGSERREVASPVRGDITNQFAGVVMDHEGRFAVRVAIDGPMGSAAVDSTVDATYNLRPSRSMVLLYLAPFLVVGALWARLLIRRRNST
jgi:hypothetical protein